MGMLHFHVVDAIVTRNHFRRIQEVESSLWIIRMRRVLECC